MDNKINELKLKLKKAKEANDFKNLIRYSDELLEYESDSDYLIKNKSIGYYKIKDYDKSIKFSKEYLKFNLSPDEESYTLSFISKCYYEKEDYVKSMEYINKSLNLTPNLESSIIHKIELYLDINEYEKALELTNRLTTKDYSYYYFKVEIYIGLQDYENVLKYVNKCIETCDNYDLKMELEITKVSILLRLKKYLECIENSKKILIPTEDKTIITRNMTLAANALNKNYINPEDIISTKKLIELNNQLSEDNWIRYYSNAYCFLELNKIDDAFENFKKANKLYGEDEIVLFSIGESYYKLFEHEKAYYYLKKALEINENNTNTLLTLAIVCSFLEKPIEVIKYGNKILKTDDLKYDSIYNLISKAYIEIGDKQNALDTIDQAISLHPDINYFYYVKGMNYFLLGEEENADEYFKIAHEMDPNDPNPLIIQITYYKNHGQMEKAAKLYEKLLELWPDYQFKLEEML